MFEDHRDENYVGELTEYEKRMMANTMRILQFTTLLCKNLLKEEDVSARVALVEGHLVERGLFPFNKKGEKKE